MLQSDEPVTWDDITSAEVVGYPSANVTTRTRCVPPNATAPSTSSGTTLSPYAAIARFSLAGMCGSTPTYQNVFDITFSAPDDSALPPAALSTLTLRIRHRREGTQDFTYTVPPPPRIAPIRRLP